MTVTADEIQAIEKWVRERKTSRAARAIADQRRRSNENPETLFQYADWYRRLGLYREGLAALGMDKGLKHPNWSDEDNRRRLIWIARMLSQCGASAFALGLIKFSEPKSPDDYGVIANIQVDHFQYAEAARSFEKLLALDPPSVSYRARLAQTGLADCRFAEGRVDEALELIDGVLERSSEPLLRAIAYSAKGEYLARGGKFGEALRLFEEAGALLPPDDVSIDSAFLYKWMGYTCVKLGKKSRGVALMDRAGDLLRGRGLRDEAWLDLMRLKLELGFLANSERDRLIFFPGLPQGFMRLLPPKSETLFRGSASDCLIDLGSDEFCQRGRWRPGISLELKLGAWISICGPWGLSRMRAKSLAWPDEVFSFLELDARLDQLLGRLRKVYNLNPASEKERIYLRSTRRPSVRVRPHDSEAALPLFLARHPKFKAQDVARWYEISRPRVFHLIARWLAAKWILKKGARPHVHYELLKE